jgi:hypothetical protein
MADLIWPSDIIPVAQSFYLQPHTSRSMSPFNRVQKVYGLSAPLWICRMTIRAGSNREFWGEGFGDWGPRLDALIAQLKGGANRVALWDFRRPGRIPSYSNLPVTAGDSQIELAGTTEGLRVGEYVGGDGRPHIVTATEVSGLNFLMTVEPHFNEDIAEGAAVFQNVPGWFRLANDTGGENETEVGEPSIYNLEFVEDPGPTADVTFDDETVTYSG